MTKRLEVMPKEFGGSALLFYFLLLFDFTDVSTSFLPATFLTSLTLPSSMCFSGFMFYQFNLDGSKRYLSELIAV